jgi:hypothetical protein
MCSWTMAGLILGASTGALFMVFLTLISAGGNVHSVDFLDGLDLMIFIGALIGGSSGLASGFWNAALLVTSTHAINRRAAARQAVVTATLVQLVPQALLLSVLVDADTFPGWAIALFVLMPSGIAGTVAYHASRCLPTSADDPR